MTQCQSCGGATDVYLCNRCVGELKTTLADLPWWIDRVVESAVGQANLTDRSGGGQRRDRHLNGDDSLASRIGEFPDERETDLDKANDQRRAQALREYLSMGGVNTRASERLDAIRTTLTSTIRHLCDIRNLRHVPAVFIGPLRTNEIREPRDHLGSQSRWLSRNVHAIAVDETAGQIHAEVLDHRQAAERIVNRPVARKYLGFCPTWNEHTRKACGRELDAREDAIEITCPKCRQTHNCNRLQLLMTNDRARKKMTVPEVLELNRCLPEEYRIPERSLRRWRKPGPKGEPPKLKPHGYQRPDGSRGINRRNDDDEPLYLWSDLERLRAERWKVGAG